MWETWVRFLGQEDPLKEENGSPIPVFLPGKSHGQKSLAGYGTWGCKKSDTTWWLTNKNCEFEVLITRGFAWEGALPAWGCRRAFIHLWAIIPVHKLCYTLSILWAGWRDSRVSPSVNVTWDPWVSRSSLSRFRLVLLTGIGWYPCKTLLGSSVDSGLGNLCANAEDYSVSMGNFSGGPGAKTLCSKCRGPGFRPWSGN